MVYFKIDDYFVLFRYIEKCAPLNKLYENEKQYNEHNRVIAILKAINYMHSNGLAHRDLKPDNVVFSNVQRANIDDVVIKIIDFGFAKSS
jgi:serine/threonine protein kinase